MIGDWREPDILRLAPVPLYNSYQRRVRRRRGARARGRHLTRGSDAVSIVGAGPTGALLAILLQRRGLRVTLYESRRDPRGDAGGSGRSINLALADRGIHALKLAGVLDRFERSLVPMRGRLVHASATVAARCSRTGSGRAKSSIPSRGICSNRALLEVALAKPGVDAKFEHRLEDADFEAGTARFEDLRRDSRGRGARCSP